MCLIVLIKVKMFSKLFVVFILVSVPVQTATVIEAIRRCRTSEYSCDYSTTCVNLTNLCDGKQHCLDGTDENEEVCKNLLSGTVISSGIVTSKPYTTSQPIVLTTATGLTNVTSRLCTLPPFPLNGFYTVFGQEIFYPGQAFDIINLQYSCHTGYQLEGPAFLFCYHGTWSDVHQPKCVSLCKLNKHHSVEYNCLVAGKLVECDEYLPTGTTVTPSCRIPNFYYPGILRLMRCRDGAWNYIAVCLAQCGRVTAEGEQLVAGGRRAERGELPWHAGIYTKTTNPFKQICGGSLVSVAVIISAAHCFWSDVKKKLPASNYAVAVGKLRRPWDHPEDVDAQKSDVREIKIPDRFQGAAANFQEDIALVIVTTIFEYKTYVRPVCVDFDTTFERRQLLVGKTGKVAGWGITAENGRESPVLLVANLPYVSIDQCISQSPPGFREFITSDKICAGYTNGTAVCKGDSGGGLAFLETERGAERYFLRGIVSTAPETSNECNVFTLTSFTLVTKHEAFIKEYL